MAQSYNVMRHANIFTWWVQLFNSLVDEALPDFVIPVSMLTHHSHQVVDVNTR